MSANHLGAFSENDWGELAKKAEFDLDALCLKLRISRRTLERHFHEHFSLAPGEWMHRWRLKAAVQLLERGMVAKEICDELHFTSETNFCHQFHRHFGCAPGEYLRRQHMMMAAKALHGGKRKDPKLASLADALPDALRQS